MQAGGLNPLNSFEVLSRTPTGKRTIKKETPIGRNNKNSEDLFQVFLNPVEVSQVFLFIIVYLVLFIF